MSYTTGQTWGALRKAWRGYKIAHAQKDKPKMKEYAEKIKALQKKLGVPESTFKDLA